MSGYRGKMKDNSRRESTLRQEVLERKEEGKEMAVKRGRRLYF
jgi:hypothetical protein